MRPIRFAVLIDSRLMCAVVLFVTFHAEFFGKEVKANLASHEPHQINPKS